ncbi:MAG: hypothetical protein ACYCX9_03790 [Candidatus Dormibacteria bacterium]
MPRRHHYGRRTARTVRRAGCCGLEAMSCCLLLAALAAAATALVALAVI